MPLQRRPHQHHNGDQGKAVDQVLQKSCDGIPLQLSCEYGASPPVNGTMVKSKLRARPKKKPPAHDKAEPIERTLTVAPASPFSIGDAVHHSMFGDGKVESIKEDKLTIAFDGNVRKVIREDFVIHKK